MNIKSSNLCIRKLSRISKHKPIPLPSHQGSCKLLSIDSVTLSSTWARTDSRSQTSRRATSWYLHTACRTIPQWTECGVDVMHVHHDSEQSAGSVIFVASRFRTSTLRRRRNTCQWSLDYSINTNRGYITRDQFRTRSPCSLVWLEVRCMWSLSRSSTKLERSTRRSRDTMIDHVDHITCHSDELLLVLHNITVAEFLVNYVYPADSTGILKWPFWNV